MTTLQALATAWRLSREVPAAVTAAQAALEAGHGPLRALRDFATVTDNALDDAAVEQLEHAIRGLLVALSLGVESAAFVAAHRDAILMAVAYGIGVVTDVGFAGSMHRVQLETWLREETGEGDGAAVMRPRA